MTATICTVFWWFLLHDCIIQIRVHLQYTGHSIANDILYLSENIVPHSARGTGPDRAVVLGKSHAPALGSSGDFHHSKDEDVQTHQEFNIDPMCTNCPNLVPKGWVIVLFGFFCNGQVQINLQKFGFCPVFILESQRV